MGIHWALKMGVGIFILCSPLGWSEEVDLGRIEVVASRFNVLDNRSFLSWSVWQAGAYSSSDVGSLLQGISPVTLDLGRGAEGVVSVVVDGFSPRQSLVMVEGIPLNNLASGQFNINRLPSSALREVRILPGAMSYLWDSGLGGLVNFSLGVEQSGVKFYSQRFGGWGASLALKSKVLEGVVELGQAYQDEFRKDRDWQKGFVRIRSGEWELLSLFYSGEVNSGVFPDDSWERDVFSGAAVGLKRELMLGDWDVQLRWTLVSDSTVVENFSSSSSEVPYRRVWTDFYRSGIWVDTSRWIDENVFVFAGGEVEWYRISSYYLSGRKDTGKVHGFGHWVWYIQDDLFWTVGAAVSYSPAYGSGFSGEVGLNWRGFRIGISRAVSTPPLLWRYYDEEVSGVASNPDIEPERAWRLDGSWEIGIGLGSLRVFGTWAWIEDAIAVDRVGSDYVMRNYKEFREQRFGVECKWRAGRLEWVGFVELHRLYDEQRGAERTGVVKDREGIRLRFDFDEGGSVIVRIWREDSFSSPAYKARDGKAIVDLELKKAFSWGEGFLRVSNLFQSEFWRDEYYPLDEGRWELGVKLHW